VSFAEVRHQPRALLRLRRALASNRVPHAYLFHGPDGVGKELLARQFAALLLCAEPVGADGDARDACGVCQSCRLVAADNHPDLHVVHRKLNVYHAESRIRNQKAVDIGVAVVRQFLIDVAGIAPGMGRAKVFIVREADRITEEAQNALLKTLEEPPAATFIILLATAVDELLPTTRSRCQLVPLGPLPAAFIAERLRADFPELDAASVKRYAALAEGSMSAALRFAGDDIIAFDREVVDRLAKLTPENAMDLARSILEYVRDASARYRQRDSELSDTAAQRAALRDVFILLATGYRDRLYAGGTEGKAASVSPAAAAQAIRVIAATEPQLDSNVNVQLAIESLIIRLARLAQFPAAAML